MQITDLLGFYELTTRREFETFLHLIRPIRVLYAGRNLLSVGSGLEEPMFSADRASNVLSRLVATSDNACQHSGHTR